VRTITQPPDPWGPLTGVRGRYAFVRPNGRRVPGWEDTNITQLAGDIGVSLRYLLGVMCGQRNCTLALLQQVARALGITLSELTNRMECAYRACHRVCWHRTKLNSAGCAANAGRSRRRHILRVGING
jgi:transcriptional regulator with XRE-family HTH domain